MPGSKFSCFCPAGHDMCFGLVSTLLFPILSFPKWWVYGTYLVLFPPLYTECQGLLKLSFSYILSHYEA